MWIEVAVKQECLDFNIFVSKMGSYWSGGLECSYPWVAHYTKAPVSLESCVEVKISHTMIANCHPTFTLKGGQRGKSI